MRKFFFGLIQIFRHKKIFEIENPKNDFVTKRISNALFVINIYYLK